MPQPPTVASHRLLTRYRDRRSRVREVVALNGSDSTVLLVDRYALTGQDCRLLAQLSPEEPPSNAAIVCADYLERLGRERLTCRRVRPSDLRGQPADAALASKAGLDGEAVLTEHETLAEHEALTDPATEGQHFELQPHATGRSPLQLRWWRCDARGPLRPVSLRDAIGALESYEPIRSLSVAACRRIPSANGTGAISVTVLRSELKRVLASPIVLNRGIREAVLERLEQGDVSMSEIATRCGRVKFDANGNASGETSWLGRRLGLLPEGGKREPTPWIHSDVLALIARSGLGMPPREVEL